MLNIILQETAVNYQTTETHTSFSSHPGGFSSQLLGFNRMSLLPNGIVAVIVQREGKRFEFTSPQRKVKTETSGAVSCSHCNASSLK